MSNGYRVDIPFPFTATCALVAPSFDADAKPASAPPSCHLLPFNLPFDGGDNNDGITVIDVTDSQPWYCFSFVHNWRLGDNGRGTHEPLTADEYFGHYYTKEPVKPNDSEQDEDRGPQHEWNPTFDTLLLPRQADHGFGHSEKRLVLSILARFVPWQ